MPRNHSDLERVAAEYRTFAKRVIPAHRALARAEIALEQALHALRDAHAELDAAIVRGDTAGAGDNTMEMEALRDDLVGMAYNNRVAASLLSCVVPVHIREQARRKHRRLSY